MSSSFKIVRFNCCGMDVHKDIIVATIGTTDRSTLMTDYIQETFGTLNPDLQKLVSWLKEHNCLDVCMESTGKYWIPPYNVLEDAGINICLAHPKYTKAIKGKKTDKKDSKWICDLYKCDLVKGSYIPPKDIRQLREIARYYFKLVYMRSSEYNRYQNCMTISNIGLGSVFTDTFGMSAQKVMNAVLESNTNEYDRDKILKLVHHSCKKKDKIMDAINGSVIESDARFKMKAIQKHKKELDELIVLRLSRNDHSQIRLIVTDLLFIMSPVRKEKTSESFVILRIILSEAGHQTVISITDYELVEIKKGSVTTNG